MSGVTIFEDSGTITDEVEELLILLHSIEPAPVEEIGAIFQQHPFDDEDVERALYVLSDRGIIDTPNELMHKHFRHSRTQELLHQCQSEDMVTVTGDGYKLEQNLRTLRIQQQTFDKYTTD